MEAARYDISIDAGATFTLPVTYPAPPATPLNLSTGYTGHMQVKRDGELLATADVTLGAGDPNITVVIDAGDTALMTAGCGVYNLLIKETGTGIVTPLLYGEANIRQLITEIP